MKMLLTGYHGTTLDNANRILKEEKFNISNKDTEWLGEGIYYYVNISDAYEWKNADAILHSVIKIDDSEYLDIDSSNGTIVFNEMLECISSLQEKTIKMDANNVQKNQYAVMKMLWESYPKIKVISASFPKTRTIFKTLLDRRPIRKEFCVRNNEYIKCTQLIKRRDLDD
ncbi:MAG: hypothetical protein HFE79_04535 [Ruminiclostridium sp.]|nr:hypothetical protein [Ruminiclostridium sp.]